MLKSLRDFFTAEKTVYSHRQRTIELIAQERNIDIETIKADIKNVMEKQDRIVAITRLKKRFHVPLSVAWRFVDKLD